MPIRPDNFAYQRDIRLLPPFSLSTDLIDFPVCIHINSASWNSDSPSLNRLFDQTINPDGKRVHFFNRDTLLPLAYEVECFKPQTQEAVYWVKMPRITPDQGANIIMAYGRPPSTSRYENSERTWTRYDRVWHLGDNGWKPVSGQESALESRYGMMGPNYGTQDSQGVIRRGRRFDGSSWIEVEENHINDPGTGPFSVSAWFRTSSGFAGLVGKDDNDAKQPGWYIALGPKDTNAGRIRAYVRQQASASQKFGDHHFRTTQAGFKDSSWHHVCAVFDRALDTVHIFVDGVDQPLVPKNQDIPSSPNKPLNQITGEIWIRDDHVMFGKGPRFVLNASTYALLNGDLDEVRYSREAFSRDWIKLEYMTCQQRPDFVGSNWVTWGAERATAGSHRQKTIVIDTSSVPSSNLSQVSDFPVCLHICRAAGFSEDELNAFFDEVYNPGGKRVRILAADGSSILSYEVQRFISGPDPSAREAVYWVKIPSLPLGSGTSLTLHYGDDPAQTDQDDSAQAWTAYDGVWHLNGSMLDSTGRNHATNSELGFPVVSDPADQSLDIGLQHLTLSFVVTPNSQSRGALVSKDYVSGGTGGILVSTTSMGAVHTRLEAGAYTYRGMSTASLTPGAQHHIHAILDRQSPDVGYWVNGAPDAVQRIEDRTLFDLAHWDIQSSAALGIGGSAKFYPGDVFDGSVESLRITRSLRSQEWIALEYLSRNGSSDGFIGDGLVAFQ